jgi:hypothetical protein
VQLAGLLTWRSAGGDVATFLPASRSREGAMWRAHRQGVGGVGLRCFWAPLPWWLAGCVVVVVVRASLGVRRLSFSLSSSTTTSLGSWGAFTRVVQAAWPLTPTAYDEGQRWGREREVSGGGGGEGRNDVAACEPVLPQLATRGP